MQKILLAQLTPSLDRLANLVVNNTAIYIVLFAAFLSLASVVLASFREMKREQRHSSKLQKKQNFVELKYQKKQLFRKLNRVLPPSIGLQGPVVYENLIDITSVATQIETIIKKYPELELNASDHEQIGDALFIEGRYDHALFHYNKAISINHEYPEVWYSIGITLGRQGEHQKALNAFKKAISYKPKYINAWIGKGIAEYKLGWYEVGIKSYNVVLNIAPDNYRAWNNKGVTFVALGRYDEAIKCFDKALEIKPDLADAMYNKACSFAVRAESTMALLFLEKAIEINPNFREIAKSDIELINLKFNNKFQDLIKTKPYGVETDKPYQESTGYFGKRTATPLVNEELSSSHQYLQFIEDLDSPV